MQKMRAAVFGSPYYKVNIVFCRFVLERVRFWVGALGRPALVAERVAHRPNSLS